MKKVIIKNLREFEADVRCDYYPTQTCVGLQDGAVVVSDDDGDEFNIFDVVLKLYDVDAEYVFPRREHDDYGELTGVVIIYDDDDATNEIIRRLNLLKSQVGASGTAALALIELEKILGKKGII